MTKSILKFFDKLEDKIRLRLSKMPLFYALIGGIGVVLFWRGVWYAADELNISHISSIVIGSVILLLTGVFVSSFIGNSLIISGTSEEKKIVEKTKDEVETEETKIKKIQSTLERLEEKVDHIEKDMHEDS